MNIFDGHPIFGVNDPATPEMLAELREEESLKGTCHGLSVATAVALIVGPLDAGIFQTIVTVGNYLVAGGIAVGQSYSAVGNKT